MVNDLGGSVSGEGSDKRAADEVVEVINKRGGEAVSRKRFVLDLIHRFNFRERQIPHDVAALRCGHYSTGKTPFKFVDAWILARFLKEALES